MIARWIVLGVLATVLAACAGEDATPIVPGATTAPTTPHLLEPTDQMRELAEQQCRDDPELDRGEVNAVDPANDEQILATVIVDCDDVE
ncbi:MAG: hypothetical protein OEV40_05760 [Acidimicrobiia bacterium]|nr:hypothetical protein [Acidimicrobiia bacterium]